MATEALPLPAKPRIRPANPKSDRLFFGAMVVALYATVYYGFARTYYAAGMIHAPLPNHLIHLHAMLMTLWMVLLFVQVALVSAGRVAWHRALGVYGFVLAIGIAIVGPVAATDSMRRGIAPEGLDALTFYIIPTTAIALFAIFVFAAWRARRQPAAHKRLIMLANIEIIGAAVGRWQIHLFQTHPPAQNLVPLAFILAIAAYDLVSQRRLQKATLWGGLLLMAVNLVRVPIGFTHAWHAFATFMLTHP